MGYMQEKRADWGACVLTYFDQDGNNAFCKKRQERLEIEEVEKNKMSI